MIYVYDTILDEGTDQLRRYGVTFTREKRFRMGKVLVYTFKSVGGEKILAIPSFAEQYREVEEYARRPDIRICGLDLLEFEEICRALVDDAGDTLEVERDLVA